MSRKTSKTSPYRVHMFVTNSCEYDGRVRKEAEILVQENCRVTVFAHSREERTRHVSGHGFDIIRIGTSFALRIFRGGFHSGNGLHRLLRGLVKIVLFLEYYFRVILLVSQKPADIYHAHDFNTLPLALVLAKWHRAKLVYDSHELYLQTRQILGLPVFAQKLLRNVESYCIRRCHLVLTVSDSFAQILHDTYAIGRPRVLMNVPMIPECNSCNGYSFREEFQDIGDSKIILFVGAIVPKRGLEVVINSLLHLEGCVLVIMGFEVDPFYKSGLNRLAREMNLHKKVYFKGAVEPEQVVPHCSSADLGIVLTKNDSPSYFSTLPNKIFEYIGAGIPVVGSHFPELDSIITGLDIGVTCKPDDPVEVTKSIRSVLFDESAYVRMKNNAVALRKKFSWENESIHLRKWYQQLM